MCHTTSVSVFSKQAQRGWPKAGRGVCQPIHRLSSATGFRTPEPRAWIGVGRGIDVGPLPMNPGAEWTAPSPYPSPPKGESWGRQAHRKPNCSLRKSPTIKTLTPVGHPFMTPSERRFAPTTVGQARNGVRYGLEQVSAFSGIRTGIQAPAGCQRATCLRPTRRRHPDPQATLSSVGL